jgi:hypothetical protein
MRVSREQSRAAHHHARSAETALQGIIFDKCRLYRVKLIAVCKPLYGSHGSFADVDSQNHTGCDRSTVQPHSACRAGPAIAANLRSCQIEWSTQCSNKRCVRKNYDCPHGAVNSKRNRHGVGTNDRLTGRFLSKGI